MALEVNGYSNPNRSDHLNAALNAFKNNPKKTWEGQHPSFYNTAEKMHNVGKVLLGFSGVFVIIAIAVPLTLLTQLNQQLIVGGTFGGGAFVSGIIGIITLTKSYWSDPADLQRTREEILDHLILNGYNKTEEKYGSVNKQYQLVSQEEVRHIMHIHYQMDQKTYSELKDDVPNSEYITPDMRNLAFLRDVQNKSVLEIFRVYGLDLIKENQQLIQNKLFDEIKDISVREILRAYDFILLKGLEDVISQKLLKETSKMSWEEIFINYNVDNRLWKLLEQGIILGPCFREKAELELKQRGIVYILRKYSPNIFKHSVLDRHALKPADYREIFSQVTFVEYHKTFAQGLSIPSAWDQKAVELALELRDATTRRLEPIPGKVGTDGQGIYKMVEPQDQATLTKTIESINERWNTFLTQTKDDK